MKTRPSYALAAFAVAFASHSAFAQNVVFTNSNDRDRAGQPYTIPVLAGGVITVAPNGDVRVGCQIDGNGHCAGMPITGGQPNPNKPTVNLSSTSADVDAAPGHQVAVGAAVALAPSFTKDPELCARSVTPPLADWEGAVVPALAAGSVVIPTAGTHTFKLRCLNENGAAESTLTITAVAGQQQPPPPPPPPPPVSGEPSACSAYRSHGFTRNGNTSVYNATSGQLGNLMRDVSTLRGLYNGLIDTSQFFLKHGPNQYIGMQFTGAQLQADLAQSGWSPGGQQHIGMPVADFAYMTVSKCAGDFRLRSDIGFNDPYMACSSELSTGLSDNMVNFSIGTHSTTPNLGSSCKIDPAATYYLNLVFADPRPSAPGKAGLEPNEIACTGTSSCGMKYGTQ